MPTSSDETSVPGRALSPASVRLRPATVDDAAWVAELHADSWRRHYRGAYADSFLDGDVFADRRREWSTRLAAPNNSETVLAEDGGRLVGFVHVRFDEDPVWGSLVDSLHVASDLRRQGLGTRLLSHAASSVARRAAGPAIFLWVLQQNTAAQHFYLALGGASVETAIVSPPGEDSTRLNGIPYRLRMAWKDVTQLIP
jgi:ribosomal protein S18 acetylase RimI-like enzyme